MTGHDFPDHRRPDPPAPSLARLLAAFSCGVWLLGAGLGFAAWVGYRTFCSMESLFPRH